LRGVKLPVLGDWWLAHLRGRDVVRVIGGESTTLVLLKERRAYRGEA
jgi:hypothetical protein